jgi:hypothetical protein
MLQSQNSLASNSYSQSFIQRLDLVAQVNPLEVHDVLKFSVNQICVCRYNYITV